jgi:hypothetical protein
MLMDLVPQLDDCRRVAFDCPLDRGIRDLRARRSERANNHYETGFHHCADKR